VLSLCDEKRLAALLARLQTRIRSSVVLPDRGHNGTVAVSEFGDAKRQLAFFGDTMNVTARLSRRRAALESGEMTRRGGLL
jgi:hypothetical protein